MYELAYVGICRSSYKINTIIKTMQMIIMSEAYIKIRFVK